MPATGGTPSALSVLNRQVATRFAAGPLCCLTATISSTLRFFRRGWDLCRVAHRKRSAQAAAARRVFGGLCAVGRGPDGLSAVYARWRVTGAGIQSRHTRVHRRTHRDRGGREGFLGGKWSDCVSRQRRGSETMLSRPCLMSPAQPSAAEAHCRRAACDRGSTSGSVSCTTVAHHLPSCVLPIFNWCRTGALSPPVKPWRDWSVPL